MCFNALGLGALNVYWISMGCFTALLNVLPFSTDCDQAMSSWLGVTHECSSIESFLNLMWCFTGVAWGLTVAFVALLPKIVANHPASSNKAAMLAITVGSLPLLILSLVVAFTIKVEAGPGVTADLVSTMGTMLIVMTVLLAVSLVVHREPTTGDKALF